VGRVAPRSPVVPAPENVLATVSLLQGYAQLPAALREVAEELKHSSVSDIAQRRGISRSTVYAWLVTLRAHVAAAGFRKSLPRIGHFARSLRSL
jgi:DNA-binding IclR family transcriptional regulator